MRMTPEARYTPRRTEVPPGTTRTPLAADTDTDSITLGVSWRF
jgi:hypothetical protein